MLTNHPVLNPTASVFAWPEAVTRLREKYEAIEPVTVIETRFDAILANLTGARGLLSAVCFLCSRRLYIVCEYSASGKDVNCNSGICR
jgi:hypothetical protein